MPDEDADYARRGGRLLPVLFWAGVGLAPLAGLLLLLGNGGSLRVGAFLGVLALVLVGLSIALRPDATAVRLQLEETLLDELDVLRAEVREDLASASRATHQMVGERLGAVQQQIDALRAEHARYPAPRSAAPAGPPPPMAAVPRPAAGRPAAAGPPVGSYRVPPPPPPPVAAHPLPQRPVAAHPMGQPMSAPPPPGRRAAPVSGPVAPAPVVSAPAAGNGRSGGGRRSARHSAGGPPGAEPRRAPPAGRAAAPAPPGGVYRHTETVQVTTRSTYVDGSGSNGAGGGRYDGGYGGRDWSAAVPRSRPAEPYEESWTDQKLRERYGGRRPRPYDRSDEDASGEQPWSRESAPWQPVSAAPVSDPGTGRAGRRRRWEDGDSPAELQLGERRAARHSDRNGTELRLEERWAAVRREDNGYGRDDSRDDYRTGGYRDGFSESEYRDPDRGEPGYGRPDYSRPALPATSSEPSWNDWDEPARESRAHRHRPDFEISDERWR
jgi:hypothetical protein